MRKLFITLVLITISVIVLVVLSMLPAMAYDQKRPEKDPVISFTAEFTYVRVVIFGTAVGMYESGDVWKTRETIYRQRGSGCVVKEGFILTAAHVINVDEVATQSGKWSIRVAKPLNVLTRTILIYDFKSREPLIAKLHYIDPELDIAILSYNPTGILEPLTCEMEYAKEELKKGDVVFSILHTRDEEGKMESNLELKYGIVLAPYPMTPKMDSELAWFNTYDITLMMDVQGGDSGSPLFALRGGKPILIGVIRAIRSDPHTPLSYAVTLPNIRRYLNVEK